MISIDEVDSSLLPELDTPGLTSIGNVYNLEPDGLTFDEEVLLTFNYDESLLNGRGEEKNLKLLRYDEVQNKWEIVPSTVSPYSNAIFAKINHFSLYKMAVLATCGDGIQNFDEIGIDCGGSCPADCIDCNAYNFGSGSESKVYSFGDATVEAAAQEALSEYAAHLSIQTGTTITSADIDTPDEKIEAVAFYVHQNMAYMFDEEADELEIVQNIALQLFFPFSGFSIGGVSIPTPSLPGSISDPIGDIIDTFDPFDIVTDPEMLIEKIRELGNPLDAVDYVADAFDGLDANVLKLSLTNTLDITMNSLSGQIEGMNFSTDDVYDIFLLNLPAPYDITINEPLFEIFMSLLYEKINEILPSSVPQSALYTLTASKDRNGTGTVFQGLHTKVEIEAKCTELDTDAGPNTTPKYCGDCEDFAVLRASLLRHLGVSEQCVMIADYHSDDYLNYLTANSSNPNTQIKDVDIDLRGGTGYSESYDYYTASDLFNNSEGSSGGHTFNVVIYQNKYRILDYGTMDTFVTAQGGASATISSSHKPDNVWNDHFGQYWFPSYGGLSLLLKPTFSFVPPEKKIHNYPGSNKCYESGKDYWTPATLYWEVCP